MQFIKLLDFKRLALLRPFYCMQCSISRFHDFIQKKKFEFMLFTLSKPFYYKHIFDPIIIRPNKYSTVRIKKFWKKKTTFILKLWNSSMNMRQFNKVLVKQFARLFEGRLPIPQFFGFHCNHTRFHSPVMYIYSRTLNVLASPSRSGTNCCRPPEGLIQCCLKRIVV